MNADGSQAFPVAADGADYNQIWTPDGGTLTYTSLGEIFERLADREDPRNLFLTRENYLLPRSWSPDGQHLAFVETSAKRGLAVTQAADVSSESGKHGLWLIDPVNVDIVGKCPDPGSGPQWSWRWMAG